MPPGKPQIVVKTKNGLFIVPQAFERLTSLQTRQLLKQSSATSQQLVKAAICGSIDLHKNISNMHWESLLRKQVST